MTASDIISMQHVDYCLVLDVIKCTWNVSFLDRLAVEKVAICMTLSHRQVKIPFGYQVLATANPLAWRMGKNNKRRNNPAGSFGKAKNNPPTSTPTLQMSN